MYMYYIYKIIYIWTNLEAIQISVEHIIILDASVEAHNKLKVPLHPDIYQVSNFYTHAVSTFRKIKHLIQYAEAI